MGVYLTGSFALGGGDAASDCDFLVVSDARATPAQERALRALHAEILDWPGPWAYNLEGSYAPKRDVETLDALGTEWLYVDRGSRELGLSTHCNTADVRWVLRERAPTLVGTRARDVACVVPESLLRETMRPGIAGFLDDLRTWASFDISWTQRYAVESPARMLYTLERGEVVSKRAALDWAEQELSDRWRGLIRQVRDDRTVAWNAPARPGSVERALAFVAYVQERARGSGS